MNRKHFFTGHENVVDDIIAFFTAKATNSALFAEILAICKDNPLALHKHNHQVWLTMGMLSMNDFIHFRLTTTKQSVPTIIVAKAIQILSDNNIILDDVLHSTSVGMDKPYRVNAQYAQFLWNCGAIHNIFYGYPYILEKYRNSVFKIEITKAYGDKSIGTGFLIKFQRFNAIHSLIITNKHVVESNNFRPLSYDDKEFSVLRHFISEKHDIAAIEIENDNNIYSFHFLDQYEILDEIITIGYPHVPQSRTSYQLIHKGEINSVVEGYWGGRHLIVSAKTGPGNSGGPVLNSFGLVIGMVTGDFFDQEAFVEKGRLPYHAAIPWSTIRDFLNNECFPALNDATDSPLTTADSPN